MSLSKSQSSSLIVNMAQDLKLSHLSSALQPTLTNNQATVAWPHFNTQMRQSFCTTTRDSTKGWRSNYIAETWSVSWDKLSTKSFKLWESFKVKTTKDNCRHNTKGQSSSCSSNLLLSHQLSNKICHRLKNLPVRSCGTQKLRKFMRFSWDWESEGLWKQEKCVRGFSWSGNMSKKEFTWQGQGIIMISYRAWTPLWETLKPNSAS